MYDDNDGLSVVAGPPPPPISCERTCSPPDDGGHRHRSLPIVRGSVSSVPAAMQCRRTAAPSAIVVPLSLLCLATACAAIRSDDDNDSSVPSRARRFIIGPPSRRFSRRGNVDDRPSPRHYPVGRPSQPLPSLFVKLYEMFAGRHDDDDYRRPDDYYHRPDDDFY